jgi:hypothetical protein
MLLAIAFGISSCSKDSTATTGPAGPAGPTGPSLTGNLSGHISCYDQYGVPVLINLSKIGMTDSLNATHVIHPDSTGAYTFAGLTTGNYTFYIHANGYGSTEVENLQFVGGGTTIHDVKISQIPNFNILTFYDSIAPATDTAIYLKGTIPSDVQSRTVVVFVGNSNVSSLPQNYLSYFYYNTSTTGTTFSIKIPQTTLNNLGFTSGSTVYFIAYGAASNFTSSSEYEDLATGRTVFTALGTPSSVVSVPVP